MGLVRNEQAKLTATYFTNVAEALMAVGTVTPIVTSLVMSGAPSTIILLVGGVCFAVSVARHMLARRVLRGLSP